MVAAGVGAAVTGLRPIVDLNFVDFAFGAMDEIINQAAKLRYMIGAEVPVVIRATAGIAGGAEQHNNSLDMWFAQTPGLHVAVPAFPADSKALIKTALRGSDPGRLPDAQEADRVSRAGRRRGRSARVRPGRDRPPRAPR